MNGTQTVHRILIVDDSPDDAELVRRALTRGGLQVVTTRVDDAQAFRRALLEQPWELVIADYSQPSFGALTVLEVLRDIATDLPCIVISGVAGEDRAVETMRAGAKDFVNKDRLQRLVPAVQRELAERENRLERESVRLEAVERDRRLRGASSGLLGLLRGSDFAAGNTAAVYAELSQLVARTLGVERVSIWVFEDERRRLRCIEAFDRSLAGHSGGQLFERRDAPAYFEALEHNRFVEAHDGAGDHAGESRSGDALVRSQLDAAVRLRGQMVGAVCLDHAGSRRVWRSDEQVFVGSIADLVALVMETGERQRAEKALRESEERYRELWQNALDGMWTIDPQGLVTSVNEAGSLLTGFPPHDVVGRLFTDFVVERDVAAARQHFASLVARGDYGPGPQPFNLLTRDRRSVQVEATAQRIERDGVVVEILAIVRDVTQRRALEAQLQQSQRMEAIGRLAGGVAHDFNNLLTAIIGYSQIAAIRPDMPAPAVIDLKEITSAAHRAAALTRQLLAFSKRQVLEPRVLNLNAVVSGIEALLRRLIGEDIVLGTDLDSNISHVLADPSQLEQVILNLAVNARDAMPNGGRLVLRTRTAVSLDPRALITADAAPGPYVVLEVVDTGLGMDEGTRQHIFEPFFTTKPLGTGLGLSTVYGIVQQSGGGIAVSSEPGRGSTFAVYLPVAAGNVDEQRTTTVNIGPSGHETILVVEDDDRVRMLATRVLRLAGYTVIEASDPQVAIASSMDVAAIDLLLTDQVLPYMRGAELYERLRGARPRLKVLFMSGYRDDPEAQGLPAISFLGKPFTPEVLTTAVRAVLDTRARLGLER